jgi:alpha-galactosidase
LILFLTIAFVVPHLAEWASGFATESRLETGQIVVEYDEKMHRRVRWLAADGPGILAFDAGVQESIRANGTTFADFELDLEQGQVQEIEHPEFGASLEGVFAGTAYDPENELRLQRRVRVLLPRDFPEAVIFENSYQNLGEKRIQIERADGLRILLDRSRDEPEARPYQLASFQGGAYEWGRDYALIWLEPGFSQPNFQGLVGDRHEKGPGGGMPFVDVWSPRMGVAAAHLEVRPQWVWLPVEVREDRRVEVSVQERPQKRLGQEEWLEPGETFHTVMTALIFHRLDFHDALHTYGRLLRARGLEIPETSPSLLYEPYWKSWSFGLDFTQQQIFDILPELRALDIRIANVDDGWFDAYGDWQPHRGAGKFPGGDADMRAFVRRLHQEGFITNLWWYPLGVEAESRLFRERSQLLVKDEEGKFPLDGRELYQLCPAYAPALEHIRQTLVRFVADWNYDGVYLDTHGLSAVPPCFNPAHEHRSPLESYQALPAMFRLISETLEELKEEPWLEVCICAAPHSPFNMPYYPLANASDPVDPKQTRRRIKVEKAIRGPTFAVGDAYQVPIQEWEGYCNPEDFPTTFGTGAQLTTFFGDLSPNQKGQWQDWFQKYRRLDLARGEYLNLYDLAFDRPEIHVVRQGEDLYYGIFAELWPRTDPIELRGLATGRLYEVYDYENDRPLGQISGNDPFLRAAFKGSLLLRLRPL